MKNVDGMVEIVASQHVKLHVMILQIPLVAMNVVIMVILVMIQQVVEAELQHVMVIINLLF